MEHSTYPLLSEKEFVEFSRRILTGEYYNSKGFYNDLADFLRTGGDTVKTSKKLSARDISLISRHDIITHVAT